MATSTLLLIIDPQFDFCDPSGALYIPGAENDMVKQASFIKNNQLKINKIIVSLDTHHVIDISHPYYWQAKESGAHPAPFTQITYNDVLQGRWIPCFEKEKAIEYLKQLETQGEFPHVIWPEHCIVGSKGVAIVDVLMDELKNWERNSGQHFEAVQKGLNSTTEMFGVFRANIPDPADSGTQENKTLINQISTYDTIILTGEAKSHCLANSLKQMFGYPDIMKKLVILEDCMSNVPGFETIALPIYEQAKELGAKSAQSDIILS